MSGQSRCSREGLKKAGSAGQACLPAQASADRNVRATLGQHSAMVGDPVAACRRLSISAGSTGRHGSTGLEDEDDWSGLMHFCRSRFHFRQSVGTKCGDEA